MIYPGFGTTGASFVVPDYLTRVQGLRDLQIGDVLNWIALPQIVLVPLVALLLKRIDARLLLVFGATMLAIASWLETGLTHDWVGGDFMVSQLIEAVGLAFAITSVIAFAVANITPALAAAIAAEAHGTAQFPGLGVLPACDFDAFLDGRLGLAHRTGAGEQCLATSAVGSHMTQRWREVDSNCRSHLRTRVSLRRRGRQIEAAPQLSWLEHAAQNGGFGGSNSCRAYRSSQAARRNNKKMLGITRSTRGSCTTRPEMIATARGCCIDAPWPIARASGSSVRIAASVVIAIGRIRF